MKTAYEIWKENKKFLHKHLQMLTEEGEIYDWHASADAFAKVFRESTIASLGGALVCIMFFHCIVDLVKLINGAFGRK